MRKKGSTKPTVTENTVLDNSAEVAVMQTEQKRRDEMLSLATFNPKSIDTNASEAELLLLQKLSGAIEQVQISHEGLAQRLAGLLYHINKKELYKAIGYKNIAEYARYEHGIMSKGTVSDAINTFGRFGNLTTLTSPEEEGYGSLKEQYKAFSFSTLSVMKGLSDEAIKSLDIKPEMSRKRVREVIASTLVLEDKKAEEQKTLETLKQMLVEARINCINAGINKDVIDAAMQTADEESERGTKEWYRGARLALEKLVVNAKSEKETSDKSKSDESKSDEVTLKEEAPKEETPEEEETDEPDAKLKFSEYADYELLYSIDVEGSIEGVEDMTETLDSMNDVINQHKDDIYGHLSEAVMGGRKVKPIIMFVLE